MPKKAKDAGEEEPIGAGRFGRCRGNLKMGLVGLPNVGKSTTFNLFCDQQVAAENFPFCTIEPTDARCEVFDERFRWLCDLWKPPAGHEIPPYLHVTDIAGLIRGASEGDGLMHARSSCASRARGLGDIRPCAPPMGPAHGPCPWAPPMGPIWVHIWAHAPYYLHYKCY